MKHRGSPAPVPSIPGDAMRDADAFGAWLDAGGDPSARGAQGMTAGHVAIHVGDAPSLRRAIEAGSDPTAADDHGQTIVWFAASHGRADLMRIAVSLGSDATRADRNGWTPLMAAAANGHADAILAAVALGCDPQVVDDDGSTAFLLSVANGADHHAEDAIRATIAAGCDPTATSIGGKTAAMLAATSVAPAATIRLVVALGCPAGAVDASGWNLAHHAADAMSVESYAAAIAVGADPTIRNHAGRSAHDIALERRILDGSIAGRMLADGVDPDRVCGAALVGWAERAIPLDPDRRRMPSPQAEAALDAAGVAVRAGGFPDRIARDTPGDPFLDPRDIADRGDPVETRRLRVVLASLNGSPIPPVMDPDDRTWASAAVARHPTAPWTMRLLGAIC